MVLHSSQQLGMVLIRNVSYCCCTSFGKGDLGAILKNIENLRDLILFYPNRSSAELG